MLKATAYIAMSGVAARLLSLVSAPILTPLLGPEPYGVMALVGALVSLGAMLFTAGIESSYTKFGLDPSLERATAAERYCWRFAIGGGLVGLCVSVGFDLLGVGAAIGLDAGYLSAAGVSVLATALSVMSLARSRLAGAYRRIAAVQVVAALSTFAINIALAFLWRRDAWVFVVGSVVGLAITIVGVGIPKVRELASPALITSDLRSSIISFAVAGSALSAPLYWIISSSDRWFLNAYWDTASVGIYAFAFNIAIVGQIVNSAVQSAWRTEAVRMSAGVLGSNVEELAAIWVRLLFLLVVTWLAVVASGGDLIKLLAAPSFHSGAALVPWISLAVLIRGVGQISGLGLILSGRILPATLSYAVAAGTCLALNAAFIPSYGVMGAAAVQAIAMGVACAGIALASRRYLRLPVRRASVVVMALMAGCASIGMSEPWHADASISLLLKLPVGCMVAGVMLLVVDRSWAIVMLRRVVRLP